MLEGNGCFSLFLRGKKETMMKHRILFILVVLHLVIHGIGCSGKEDQSESKEANTTVQIPDSVDQGTTIGLIQPGIGVGKVKLDMTADDVKAILGEPDSDVEGDYFLHADLGIEVLFKDGKVCSIFCVGHIDSDPNVKACKYRTEKGIGIGSTESDIESAYGKAFKLCDGTLLYRDLKFGIENGRAQTIRVRNGQW
jgi:hypothetical protein